MKMKPLDRLKRENRLLADRPATLPQQEGRQAYTKSSHLCFSLSHRTGYGLGCIQI